MYNLSQTKDTDNDTQNPTCQMSNNFNCCPPLPHYSLIVSDDDFVERNILLSETSGEKFSVLDGVNSDVPGGYSKFKGVNAAYPGGCPQLAEDERNTMPPCQRMEYDRQEAVARRGVYPQKYWQDLNQGRHYARGLSDDLDLTMSEQNNFSSGWYNGKEGLLPGAAPYRNPYCENGRPGHCKSMLTSERVETEDDLYCQNHPAFNPDCARKPMVNMTSMGSRSYKWDTIYDAARAQGVGAGSADYWSQYPQMFCKSGQYNWQPNTKAANPRCDPPCYKKYPPAQRGYPTDEIYENI